jgi:hypothetical protein
MSKLADRVRRAARVEPAPLGFAAAARTQTATMLIVVKLGGDTGKVKEALEKGADAVVLEVDAGKLRGAKIPDGTVVGVSTDKLDGKEAPALREAGADFAVVSEDSAASGLLDEKLGFVMRVAGDLEDTRLRLVGDLSLDAIIVETSDEPLTVARLLDLRRLVSLARAPMLVESDSGIDASALQVLRDAGAAGLLLPASAIGKLGELRERIMSLPARGKRREDGGQTFAAAQPAVVGAGEHEDDFDDDD